MEAQRSSRSDDSICRSVCALRTRTATRTKALAVNAVAQAGVTRNTLAKLTQFPLVYPEPNPPDPWWHKKRHTDMCHSSTPFIR